MNSEKSTQTTLCSCPEILIIPSGFDTCAIHECIVESGSALTSEEIFQQLTTLLKTNTKQAEQIYRLTAFILEKSEEESMHSYLDYYQTMIELALRAMSLILYFLETNKNYADNKTKYKYFKLLPSADILISTEPLCNKTKRPLLL